jgi:hypothetical protein
MKIGKTITMYTISRRELLFWIACSFIVGTISGVLL